MIDMVGRQVKNRSNKITPCSAYKEAHRKDKKTHQEEEETYREDKETHREDKEMHREDKEMHREDKETHREDKETHREDKETHREDKERLHYALTASEEGIWDWNLKSDTGYLSPRYYEMLGYRANEFPCSTKIWADMLHPDDKSKALKEIVDLIWQKQKNYRSVYRMVGKDGACFWILSRGIVVRWDDQGIPLRLVGTHMDITRTRGKDEAMLKYKANLEKEVEKQTKELKTANLQLETILNASSESIWVLDAKGKILSINNAAEKLLNIRTRDLIGKNMKFLEKKGFLDQSVVWEVLKTRSPVTIMQNVTITQNSKKTRKQLLVTGTPVFDDNGEISMIIANERDLTRLNELRDELQRAQSTTSRYKEELTTLNLQELKDQEIIAESKEMQHVIATAMKLARLKVSPILIMGESGTGKGLLAKFIHSQSCDRKKPFVQINCAALPETLLEAELFGYEKGAFTGARDQGKIGLFEMAKGGTLLFDELGEMSLTVQAKLLKCLEDKEIMHLGGLKPIKIDCTVIVATNLNMSRQVQHRKFRQDLFFRLNTFAITLPSLRKRPEDILEIVMFFLEKYNKTYGVKKKISSKCLQQIQSYPFPGNVRELKNMLKKAVVMGESDVLEDLVSTVSPAVQFSPAIQFSSAMQFSPGMQSFPDIHTALDIPNNDVFNFSEKMLEYEKMLILQALEIYDTTRSLAQFLKLSQSSVVRKLKIHGLSKRLRRNAQKDKLLQKDTS